MQLKLYAAAVLLSTVFTGSLLYFHPHAPTITIVPTTDSQRPDCHVSLSALREEIGLTVVANSNDSVPCICEVPPTGFKSWKDGVVTELSPRIQRNCSKLFEGQERSILEVKSKLKQWKNQVSDYEVLQRTRRCSWVREYLNDNLYTTKLEASFPLAFSFVVHNAPQQILRLFRFLYRPHNVYCIHPDKKSSSAFFSIFRNIAGCLDNVIIPKQLVSVVWSKASVLEAGMSCLKELAEFRESQPENEKWKHVLNLCGKELPMTTTHGIVRYLSKLNGSSNIRAKEVSKKDRGSMERLKNRKIPYNATYYKSATYMSLSYKFVNHVLTNPVAIELYEFFRECSVPDEHYYATLSRMPGVPGGFDPNFTYIDTDSYFWSYGKTTWCSEQRVHSICIVSVKELNRTISKSGDGEKSLFHNKYFMEMDHLVMDCMEERLVARNIEEFKQDCSPT